MQDLAAAIKMLEVAQRGFTAIATYAGREEGKSFSTFEQVRDFAYSRASYIEELLQKITIK